MDDLRITHITQRSWNSNRICMSNLNLILQLDAKSKRHARRVRSLFSQKMRVTPNFAVVDHLSQILPFRRAPNITTDRLTIYASHATPDLEISFRTDTRLRHLSFSQTIDYESRHCIASPILVTEVCPA